MRRNSQFSLTPPFFSSLSAEWACMVRFLCHFLIRKVQIGIFFFGVSKLFRSRFLGLGNDKVGCPLDVSSFRYPLDIFGMVFFGSASGSSSSLVDDPHFSTMKRVWFGVKQSFLDSKSPFLLRPSPDERGGSVKKCSSVAASLLLPAEDFLFSQFLTPS